MSKEVREEALRSRATPGPTSREHRRGEARLLFNPPQTLWFLALTASEPSAQTLPTATYHLVPSELRENDSHLWLVVQKPRKRSKKAMHFGNVPTTSPQIP
ncbi:hypothetical protein M427DRAFT_39099 [Gonapodya prolifera JEL478]|uniref:Uncharacterized protein n=1 Tax=Gonapodya prolifera (strain JEL478) TaxID=1344416 RepID=A0A138ZXS7_GONPJ|nr:hypothetical protein M427DRAFT_39099 [Gonapodya prolifera JEL478]|eukprot:KXS09320.1 hypothetical protein M427DRAFT_39099 [Gonapodya prolifera JEL478]